LLLNEVMERTRLLSVMLLGQPTNFDEMLAVLREAELTLNRS